MTTKEFKEKINSLFCERNCDNVFVEVKINGTIFMYPIKSIGTDDDADWIIRLEQ